MAPFSLAPILCTSRRTYCFPAQLARSLPASSAPPSTGSPAPPLTLNVPSPAPAPDDTSADSTSRLNRRAAIACGITIPLLALWLVVCTAARWKLKQRRSRRVVRPFSLGSGASPSKLAISSGAPAPLWTPSDVLVISPESTLSLGEKGGASLTADRRSADALSPREEEEKMDSDGDGRVPEQRPEAPSYTPHLSPPPTSEPRSRQSTQRDGPTRDPGPRNLPVLQIQIPVTPPPPVARRQVTRNTSHSRQHPDSGKGTPRFTPRKPLPSPSWSSTSSVAHSGYTLERKDFYDVAATRQMMSGGGAEQKRDSSSRKSRSSVRSSRRSKPQNLYGGVPHSDARPRRMPSTSTMRTASTKAWSSRAPTYVSRHSSTSYKDVDLRRSVLRSQTPLPMYQPSLVFVAGSGKEKQLESIDRLVLGSDIVLPHAMRRPLPQVPLVEEG